MSAALELPPVLVREGRGEDLAFILSAWSRSFERSPAARHADPSHYRCEVGILIGKLLKSAKIRIAYDSADPDTIAGFAVHTGSELHYIYVRGGEPDKSLRHMGIARLLLEGVAIKSYTFRTESFERRMKPRDRGWLFTPRWTL